MEKLKVLLLLHEMNLTGAPMSALRTFEGQTEVELRTLSLYRGPLEERYRQLGPVQCLLHPPETGFLNRVRKGVQRRLDFRAWMRSVHQWQPDVIYCNSVASLLLVARVQLPDAPVLMHAKEMGTSLAHYVAVLPGFIPARPQHYIAASNAVKHSLTNDHNVRPQDVTVIHNFIDEKVIGAVGNTTNAASKVFTVGGAGNLSWCKGDVLWLQMAAELKDLMGADNVRFVWVGVANTQAGEQFRDMARKLHVEPLIEFVPQTTTPLEHFKEFDVFALTSWEDSCPAVVLEAMALEKPVVCFAGSGGAPEQIGETGIAVEGFSPRLMATAIANLAASPEHRSTLGQAGRARVLEQFTIAVQAPKILDVMKRVAASSQQKL